MSPKLSFPKIPSFVETCCDSDIDFPIFIFIKEITYMWKYIFWQKGIKEVYKNERAD